MTDTSPSSNTSSPRKSPQSVHTFGQAQSTAGNLTAAMNTHNFFRAHVLQVPDNKTTDQVTYAEIEGDNLQNYFFKYGKFMAETAIPTYANEFLKPRNPKNAKCLTTKTLKGYIGCIFTFLRRKYPKHVDFKDLPKDKSPLWYTEFLAQFEKMSTRYQIQWVADTDNIVFGERSVMPLYSDNSVPRYSIPHEIKNELDELPDWWTVDNQSFTDSSLPLSLGQNCDLKHICRKLMLTAAPIVKSTNYQLRTLILLCFQDGGEGGDDDE